MKEVKLLKNRAYCEIDELRMLLNEMVAAQAPYDAILRISRRLDGCIVSYHHRGE